MPGGAGEHEKAAAAIKAQEEEAWNAKQAQRTADALKDIEEKVAAQQKED